MKVTVIVQKVLSVCGDASRAGGGKPCPYTREGRGIRVGVASSCVGAALAAALESDLTVRKISSPTLASPVSPSWSGVCLGPGRMRTRRSNLEAEDDDHKGRTFTDHTVLCSGRPPGGRYSAE